MEKMEKKKIQKEVKELETRIEITKDAKMREILELLPAGITLRRVKFAFVDKVINRNKGNLTAAAREMCVPYRTLVNWVHETDNLTAEARGRVAGGKARKKVKK